MAVLMKSRTFLSGGTSDESEEDEDTVPFVDEVRNAICELFAIQKINACI